MHARACLCTAIHAPHPTCVYVCAYASACLGGGGVHISCPCDVMPVSTFSCCLYLRKHKDVDGDQSCKHKVGQTQVEPQA